MQHPPLRSQLWVGLRVGLPIIAGLFVFPKVMAFVLGGDPDPTWDLARWAPIGLVAAVLVHFLLPRTSGNSTAETTDDSRTE